MEVKFEVTDLVQLEVLALFVVFHEILLEDGPVMEGLDILLCIATESPLYSQRLVLLYPSFKSFFYRNKNPFP